MTNRGVVEERKSELEGETANVVVTSALADGSEPCLMQIECGFTRGFAGMQLIGNTDEVCRDGKERARAALEALGLDLPARRLVVNLTPAEVKKNGSHLDLPIAVCLALLLSPGERTIDVGRWVFAAELGIHGQLRPVRGVVPFAVAAMAAGLTGVVVAAENLPELEVLASLTPAEQKPLVIRGFRHLRDLLAWLNGGVAPEPTAAVDGGTVTYRSSQAASDHELNFDDMVLPPILMKAALVAASGMHSLLLRGTPGSGKSMFAARLPSLLPALDKSERIAVMRVHSAICEQLPQPLLTGRPPYRAPHHQASAASILGNASLPGELALAHSGILFLDELPEFRRDVLEGLREPIETGEVRVSRSHGKVTWQARVMLIAACNNCPCGWAASTRRKCRCSSAALQHYRRRLSGPILDRIDIHLNVPEAAASGAELFRRLAAAAVGPKGQTALMVLQVGRARARALDRNRHFSCRLNRDLPAQDMISASGLADTAFGDLIGQCLPRTTSHRSLVRCLRVARTLADLADSDQVRDEDLVQAWEWQAEGAAAARGEDLDGYV